MGVALARKRVLQIGKARGRGARVQGRRASRSPIGRSPEQSRRRLSRNRAIRARARIDRSREEDGIQGESRTRESDSLAREVTRAELERNCTSSQQLVTRDSKN